MVTVAVILGEQTLFESRFSDNELPYTIVDQNTIIASKRFYALVERNIPINVQIKDCTEIRLMVSDDKPGCGRYSCTELSSDRFVFHKDSK